METIEVHQYRSLANGPRLLVLGAVHGNETCGPTAIRSVAAQFATGERRLARGVLTLVPVANPVAFKRGTREGDRNLNRDFRPSVCPENAEDRIANHLAPILRDHDALLDLHSFAAEGSPFVFMGPEDNEGDLEPFRRAREEFALARAVGPRRLVYGWLPAYARGVARRPGGSIAYGIGTTEYMRSQGGYAVTVECGQHADPQAPAVARQAIENTLALLGLCEEPSAALDVAAGAASAAASSAPSATSGPIELIEMCEVFDRHDASDSFVGTWRSFDRVVAGQPIARRAGGEPVKAPADGYVVFPNPNAVPGREWFYFARPGQRA
ncbi:MAG: succinylglutamate desuccinylase [Burkholderiaceae bacterium]|nr:succinylglutamate desuccinylase [Burkholderiaceae bacterium]